MQRSGLAHSQPARVGITLIKRVTALCASLFAIALPSGVALAASPPAMIMPGQYSVSPSGALVYTVPIAVPPGTGGMAPALSLDYSSQSGDGLEGFGWTLSGLPSVGRCGQTFAQDGKRVGVTYNDSSNTSVPISDRLCMNGQRLVAIKGVYGRDGSEYRTEIEGFSKILVHGISGINGPGWIEIHTKAGQIMEFGNTTDSRISPVQAVGSPLTTVVRSWAVDKISDSVGNYLTVTYSTNSVGETRPDRIDYTGHTASPITSPFNSVRFTYGPRPDSAPQYQAGMVQQVTDLLTDITTYSGPTTAISHYVLVYGNGTTTTHSRLTSVTLCGGSGTCTAPCDKTANCLASTAFGWQGGLQTLSINQVSSTVGQGGYIHYGNGKFFTPNGNSSSDFNGDGLTDVIVLQPGNGFICGSPFKNTIFLGQLDGSFVPANMQSHFSGDNGSGPSNPFYYPDGDSCFYDTTSGIQFTYPADLDGDGFTDVTAYNESAITPHWMLLNNDRVGNFNRYYNPPGAFVQLADYNGDGLVDAVSNTGYELNQTALPGSFAAQPETFPSWTDFTLTDATLVGDFDGDGCGDFLYQIHLGPKEIFYNPVCSTTAAWSVPDWLYDSKQVTLGDFNGDGKTDILVTSTNAPAVLYLSTGTSLTAITLDSTTNDWGKYVIVAGDWNGDGKTDIALIAAGAGGYAAPKPHLVMLSTGTSFVLGAQIANAATSPVSVSVGDWNSDGTQDIWLQQAPGDFEELMSAQAGVNYAPEAIATIDNGIGSVTTVTYDRINNPALYTKATDGAYPTQNVVGPIYVVSRIDASNGRGVCTPPSMTNCYSSTYTYGGGKADLSGRGFLGFQTMTISDLQTNIVQSTTYFTDFPEAGLIHSQTKTCPDTKTGCPVGGVILTSLQETYDIVSLGTGTDGVKRSFVALQKAVVSSNDLDQTAMPTSTTTYTYDCDTLSGGTSICAGTSATGFGNALTVSTALSDGSFKTTTNTYNTFVANWFLGRLLTANVESKVGTSDLIRQTSYFYPIATGLLTRETIEPETSSDKTLQLTTGYGYDPYGNKSSSASKGCVWLSATNCSNATATATRETDMQYDDTVLHGQFLTKTTNALGQNETWAYAADINTGFGLPSGHTGPNGLTTSFQYDAFGRKTLQVQPTSTSSPGGNQEAVAYYYCSAIPCAGLPSTISSIPAFTQFIVVMTPESSVATGSLQNGPISIAYYDSLSRQIGTDVEGFDGTGSGCTAASPCWIRVQTQYDSNGRPYRTSRPYFVSGGTLKWTTNSYDAIGRVYSVLQPGSVMTSYGFDGLTTTIVNDKGQTTTTNKNAQGLVASVRDNEGNTTSYVYDAFGDLLTVTDPMTNTTTYGYDIRGRKLTASDPDMGSWTYIYDGFGELYSQVDAKTNLTTLKYDILGRIVERDERDLVSNWTFDTASGAGIGQLASATTNGGYVRTFSYDALGRPAGIALTVDGGAYNYSESYDLNGHLITVGYPSGFSATYNYTALGYSANVSQTGSPGTVFWTANTRDAELHLLTQTAGNGIVTTQTFDPNNGRVQSILAGAGNTVSNQTFNFDTLGNLTRRTWLDNTGTSQRENACYDDLNRLTSTRLTNTNLCTGGGTTITIAYDALGDITEKTDVCAAANCMAYGSGAGPHALTSISGTYNGVSNPTFSYDANGNMVAGGGRTVTSTSFNMAALITDGANSVALTYDSEHKRIKQSATGSGVTVATLYLNDPMSGALEEKVGPSTRNDYIMADGHMVAERIATINTVVEYFTLDHLGSISVVTDATGNVLQRLSYDAWGRRRNSDGTSDTSCSITSTTTRGFTGQEMMPSLCLINFNARVYDPTLGRFMSADPVTQSVYNLQLLNHYSYVGNNPLSLTDPTGLCFLGCFWNSTIFKDIVAIFIAIVLPEALEALDGAAFEGVLDDASVTTLNVGIAGGVAGYITTGSATGAFFGAIQADAFLGTGDFLQSNPTYFFGSATATTFIAHGMVGGLFSVNSKGGFLSGFLSAGVSSLADSPALDTGDSYFNTAEHAILGGAGSVLGGGKFQNGAVTASFGYLYNSAMHAGGSSGSGSSPDMSGALDALGAVWALPTTTIGLTLGLVDSLVSLGISGELPQITFGNDAIQISNLQIGKGGLTFGNVQLYSGYQNGVPVGPGTIIDYSTYTHLSEFLAGTHEEAHTLQTYILGPFFVPVWIVTGGVWGPSPLETQADLHAAGGSAWPW